MTESQKLIKQATISVDQWMRRSRDANYNWRDTWHGRALLQLEKEAKAQPVPTPAPSPAPSTLAAQLQSVIYCAQNPLAALAGPKRMKPALTADPGYASFTTPDVVAQLKAHFGTCGGWFVQTQVPVQHAKDFVAQYGLDFLIFQGETENEYATAMQYGARLVVGNANAWSDGLRKDAAVRIANGTLAFAQEAYTNLGNPWPDQTSTQGVPAASLVLGVYDGSAEVPGHGWYPGVGDYKLHTSPSVWQTISVYHAAGLRSEDWAAL